MSRWMVNVRGQQFSAANMDELKSFAKKGEVGGGDIVQPPGATEWLYAIDIPELKASLRPAPMDELDMPPASTGFSPVVKGIFAGFLAITAVGLWGYALSLKDAIPKPGSLELIGKNLQLNEVLVTSDGAQLHAEASTSSAAVSPLPKNEKAELLAKRGTWYKLRFQGKEGYTPVEAVVPGYYFAKDEQKLDYDPIYNPDKYVYVMNSSWTQPTELARKGMSNMSFMLQNDSKFEMTGLKIVAALKDAGGQVVEQKEIPVEGVMRPQRNEMVGTLMPARGDRSPARVMLTSDFEKVVAEDPSAAERWIDGVEVTQPPTASEASVTLVEVQAIPMPVAAN